MWLAQVLLVVGDPPADPANEFGVAHEILVLVKSTSASSHEGTEVVLVPGMLGPEFGHFIVNSGFGPHEPSSLDRDGVTQVVLARRRTPADGTQEFWVLHELLVLIQVRPGGDFRAKVVLVARVGLPEAHISATSTPNPRARGRRDFPPSRRPGRTAGTRSALLSPVSYSQGASLRSPRSRTSGSRGVRVFSRIVASILTTTRDPPPCLKVHGCEL